MKIRADSVVEGMFIKSTNENVLSLNSVVKVSHSLPDPFCSSCVAMHGCCLVLNPVSASWICAFADQISNNKHD